MSDDLLYLSRSDVRSLGLSPRDARAAVLQAFRDHAEGLNRSLPKSSLDLGPGHGFQAMPAASSAEAIATLKWVAMAPVPAGSAAQGINALICVSDYASGAPLAILDGDEITLIRTAAMSAAAASYLAPANPRTIGFVGCGQQAYAHLEAFLDLYPGLTTALLLSRSRASAERLAEAAASRGLSAEIASAADQVLSRSDIVISMVPGAPGLEPFLDATRMPAASFACAVDIGRSWRPETLTAFDFLATDSLAQSTAPYDVNSKPVETVRFQDDLIHIVQRGSALDRPSRAMFCFRGFALADLALAGLTVRKAREAGIGTRLRR